MADHSEPTEWADRAQEVGVQRCAWHSGYSVTTLLVQDADGDVHPACFSCRQAYDLTPVSSP